jgi:hypothetical protein
MFNANAARELTESNRYKIKEQEQKYLDHALNIIKEAAKKGFYRLCINKEEEIIIGPLLTVLMLL